MNTLYIYGAILISTILIACGGEKKSESTAPQDRRDAKFAVIDSLSELLDKDGYNPELWAARAAEYHKLKAYDEAIFDYTQAKAQDSLNPAYPIALTEVYLDYGDAFKAQLEMNKAAYNHPNDLETFIRYARLLLIMQEYDQAIKAAARAKTLGPGDAEVEYTRGLIFLDQGKLKGAENAFRLATELDASHAESWAILGELAVRQNKQGALQYFNNALRSDPDHVGALHGAAYQIQNQGQVDSAIAIYERIHQIDPSYPEAYFNKAMLLLERDSIDLAAGALNTVVRIDNKSGIAYYYLGYIWEKRGDLKQALHEYEIAEHLLPDEDRVKAARSRIQRLLEEEKNKSN